jgi:molecular chaperone GrpE
LSSQAHHHNGASTSAAVPNTDHEAVSDSDAAKPAHEECEARIATIAIELAEAKDRMLRIAADFDNWKKRARKDQVDGEMRVKESVLHDFLEIVDGLERAAACDDSKENDAKSIRNGVELVLRQFRSKLERYQRMHEAISQVPSADVKPGSVLHELQKGYVIGEKLLRPAMVVVAAAPSPA